MRIAEFIVYKTINLVNGKFYIGVHKQPHNQEDFDGYWGSGKILAAALSKYGEENFKRITLRSGLQKEEAYQYEREVLSSTSKVVCYNLHEGGKGGFEYINSTGQNNNGNHQAGSGNSQYGLVYYCDPLDMLKKPVKYKPGTQPEGWIPSKPLKALRAKLRRQQARTILREQS